MDLGDEVDRIVRSLAPFERSWLGSQLQRAILSIASNIAEGHGAEYRRVYVRHVSIARASLAEAETQLLVISRRQYLPEARLALALSLTQEIGKMLRRLAERLRAPKS
jgi:four helix bundle protein